MQIDPWTIFIPALVASPCSTTFLGHWHTGRTGHNGHQGNLGTYASKSLAGVWQDKTGHLLWLRLAIIDCRSMSPLCPLPVVLRAGMLIHWTGLHQTKTRACPHWFRTPLYTKPLNILEPLQFNTKQNTREIECYNIAASAAHATYVVPWCPLAQTSVKNRAAPLGSEHQVLRDNGNPPNPPSSSKGNCHGHHWHPSSNLFKTSRNHHLTFGRPLACTPRWPGVHSSWVFSAAKQQRFVSERCAVCKLNESKLQSQSFSSCAASNCWGLCLGSNGG